MRYIEANEALQRSCGYSREQMLQMYPWEVSPVPRERFEELYRTAVEISPQPLRAIEMIEGCGPNGEDTFHDVQRQAVQVDGRWVIIVTRRDVTERLQEQARLDRFATALDLSGDCVILVDRETMKYVDANRTAIALAGH